MTMSVSILGRMALAYPPAAILGGPWDLVTTYNWDYNPTYNWGNPYKSM